MGVLYDYFRAADTAHALRAMDKPGGPMGKKTPDQPAFDGIDTKNLDPYVVFGQLIAIIDGREWDPGTVTSLSIWPGPQPTREEWNALPEDSPWHTGPWLEQLGDGVRDSLAALDDSRLPQVVAAWIASGEIESDPAHLQAFVKRFVALAQRAQAADEHLYCWSCL